MAAGLGFKNFSSGEVLTAADVNGYLMQGVLVFASAAARDAAITSPQEGQFAFTKDTNGLWYYDGAAWVASGATGDIEGVTAGVGISGGGTSGTVTVTNSMATAIDAKGDLVAGTGADAFSRLAVGANDTVLTADSTAATGLKWATPASGSMTLISTTSLASGSSVTISSIPGTYKNLSLVIRNFFPSMNGTNLRLRFNGDANSRYAQVQGFTNLGNATATSMNIAGGSLTQIGNTAGENKTLIETTIPDYANAVTIKVVQSVFYGNSGTSGGFVGTLGLGGYNQTTAITSIDLLPDQGNFNGGSALLYGVN